MTAEQQVAILEGIGGLIGIFLAYWFIFRKKK